MADERCGKLGKNKEKRREKESKNSYNFSESPNKMQKMNKVEQEDFDFGAKEAERDVDNYDVYNKEKKIIKEDIILV